MRLYRNTYRVVPSFDPFIFGKRKNFHLHLKNFINPINVQDSIKTAIIVTKLAKDDNIKIIAYPYIVVIAQEFEEFEGLDFELDMAKLFIMEIKFIGVLALNYDNALQFQELLFPPNRKSYLEDVPDRLMPYVVELVVGLPNFLIDGRFNDKWKSEIYWFKSLMDLSSSFEKVVSKKSKVKRWNCADQMEYHGVFSRLINRLNEVNLDYLHVLEDIELLSCYIGRVEGTFTKLRIASHCIRLIIHVNEVFGLDITENEFRLLLDIVKASKNILNNLIQQEYLLLNIIQDERLSELVRARSKESSFNQLIINFQNVLLGRVNDLGIHYSHIPGIVALRLRAIAFMKAEDIPEDLLINTIEEVQFMAIDYKYDRSIIDGVNETQMIYEIPLCEIPEDLETYDIYSWYYVRTQIKNSNDPKYVIYLISILIESVNYDDQQYTNIELALDLMGKYRYDVEMTEALLRFINYCILKSNSCPEHVIQESHIKLIINAMKNHHNQSCIFPHALFFLAVLSFSSTCRIYIAKNGIEFVWNYMLQQMKKNLPLSQGILESCAYLTTELSKEYSVKVMNEGGDDFLKELMNSRHLESETRKLLVKSFVATTKNYLDHLWENDLKNMDRTEFYMESFANFLR